MGNEAQPHRNADGDQVLSQGAGWDPYEVWFTRIRPHQHSIELVAAQSAALRRRRHATRMFFRFDSTPG